MLYLFISIFGILITIFFVIGTHEFAHFLVARSLGIKVLRFSIGFGKTLWHRYDKKGTEYVVALIPLGGYVKMLDENEGTVPKKELHLAFNRQPFYKKFLVVVAGPLTNIFCAFFLYWLIFVIGFTTVRPMIGDINPRSIAAEGGLQTKQEIISIDNSKTSTWTSVIFRLIAHAGNPDHIKIEVQNPPNKQPSTETHILDLSNWHLDTLTPDPLASLGITPFVPNIPLIIGIIADDSPAASSSLRIGDKLIALDKKPINNWDTLITYTTNHPDQSVTLTIERQGKTLNIPVTLGAQKSLFFTKTGYLGIGPNFKWPKEFLQDIKYDPITAISHAWKEISDFTYFNLLLFWKMVTGKLSLQGLGGPITIFQTAGNALNSGFISFISFLAFLSISIGIINLIPIPGLDGGHILIQFIEFVIRRPVSEQVLSILYRLGFIFLLFIIIQALVNDILRWLFV